MSQKTRNTISTTNRLRSSSPEYYIDLTVDSPVTLRTSSVRRTLSNRTSRSTKHQNNDDSSQAENLENAELEVIERDSNADANRLLPPKKRSRQRNDINKVKVDAIIDLNESKSPDDVARLNDSADGRTNVLSCPICFEFLCSKRKPTSTRCGHVYCADCIEQTLVRSKKCPKCQVKITAKSCIRLYL